jgi:hypothetical protein
MGNGFRCNLLACFVLVAGCLMNAAANESNENVVIPNGDQQVRLRNVPRDVAVDREAVKKAATRIVALVQENKLVPTRVELFADHPIVKEALQDKALEITMPATPAVTVLVPFSHNGNRVIVKRGNDSAPEYSLFSLPPDAAVDLKACLK